MAGGNVGLTPSHGFFTFPFVDRRLHEYIPFRINDAVFTGKMGLGQTPDRDVSAALDDRSREIFRRIVEEYLEDFMSQS